MSLATVVDTLRRFYGRLAEPPADPFGYFLWEVVAADTTPAKRDAAFAAFKKIPALTPDAVHRAPPARIAAAIALAGSHRERRLEALLSGSQRFRQAPRLAMAIAGPLKAARRALRGLPVLGESGARRMLLFGGNHSIVPVDAGLDRVVTRLGFVNNLPSTKKRQRFIRRYFAAEWGNDRGALRTGILYLGHHAALACIEREPHCGVCPLREGCAYAAHAGRI